MGRLIEQHHSRFPADMIGRSRGSSKSRRGLRKEREVAFYGDIDFIPTEQYGRVHAERALHDAQFVVEIVGRLSTYES